MRPAASLSDLINEQVSAVVDVVRSTLANDVEAAYLYGSAVEGGLQRDSDLDFFVVVTRPTTRLLRECLVARLAPVSDRRRRPPAWRPVEMTIVVRSDVHPWHYPPRTDFQYGEWLRVRFDAGDVDPERPLNPDLAVLIAMVRRTGQQLMGPSPIELLDEVPAADLSRALAEVIPALIDDVGSDTANVLLTLARIWHTTDTGGFAPKDAAADWVMKRLPAHHRSVMRRARAIYLGEVPNAWADRRQDASQTAGAIVEQIRRGDTGGRSG